MPNSIPDIPFRSYDEFRKWERALESMEHIVSLLKENKTNVALCEELAGMLESVASDSKEAFFDLIDEWCAQDEDKCKLVFVYQDEASTLAMQSVHMADQVAQVQRREDRA